MIYGFPFVCWKWQNLCLHVERNIVKYHENTCDAHFCRWYISRSRCAITCPAAVTYQNFPLLFFNSCRGYISFWGFHISISADIVFLFVISIYNSFQCFDKAARIPSWIPTCIGTATLMHFLHELTPLVAGHYRSVCTSGPRSANFSWLGVNHKYNPEIWVMSPSASSTHMG